MPSGLSIIICTKNRPADLGITLGSVFQQRSLPDNLVIVDDGNADDTRTLLKKYDSISGVRIIHFHPKNESSGLPAARNLGIGTIPDQTGIILFLDDDVTLEESYLEIIQDLFLKNPDLCGATGFIRTGYHDRSLPVKVLLLITGTLLPCLIPVSLFGPRVTWTADSLYPIFKKPMADTVPAQWLSGCNMAYRSTVFCEGARFDEHLVFYALGEDMLFSHLLHLDRKKLLLSYNARLIHRISGESRIPLFRKLAMTFGYRNYEISRFVHNRLFSAFFYTVFIVRYLLSSVIISLKNENGLAQVKEVIRANSMTREFWHEIRSGNLERFNDFLSTLPKQQ